MADFLNNIGKQIARQAGVPTSVPNGQQAERVAQNAVGNQVRQGLGGLWGKVTEISKDGAEFAGNVAKVTGAKTILNTQYPESVPLGQSPRMNTFVESGLRALDLFRGNPDGKPGADTLAGINGLRAGAGQAPLSDVNQVSRDDVGLMVDQLARKGTPAANNVLSGAISTLGNLKGDYPKPEAPAAAPPVQRTEPQAP